MDFLKHYQNDFLVPLGEQCEGLEKKIKRKWIFASKEEKEHLKILYKRYKEGNEWLERQLYLESLISSNQITKIE